MTSFSPVLANVWERLSVVKELSFESRSSALQQTGWSGKGRGVVEVTSPQKSILIFHEQGSWTQDGEASREFTNVFRWTLNADSASLNLEHLRFGVDRPVELFELIPTTEALLKSSTPHLCRNDCYAAEMKFDLDEIRCKWTVNGPEKNETIVYRYW